MPLITRALEAHERIIWSTKSYQNTATDGGGGIFVRYILVIALCLCGSTPPAE